MSHHDSTTTDLRQTLTEMCRPFGLIQHWTVECANEGLYRCLVRLDEPEKHALVAETLGGDLQDEEICLEIRVR